MTTYRITQPDPPAAALIRIRRIEGGPWLPVPLLALAGDWVQVDDGAGPLWVMVDHVHRGDWGILDTFERLSQSAN